MKSLCKLIPFSLAAAVAGCALADFKPYVGAQQKWPTAPGTFMDTKYAVPTFYGPPSRPYRVLGYLDAKTAPVRRRGVVAFAARRAKELGGDAIVVLQEGIEHVGTYSTGSTYTSGQISGSYSGRTNYLGAGAYQTNGNLIGTGFTTSQSSALSIPMFAGKAGVLVIKFL